MSRVPTPNIDYSSRDYEGFRDLMIAKLQEKMPEYTDTSETDAGIVIIEALANGLDILSLYADIVANDVFLPTTQNRRLAILIASCLGYIPYNQTASEYKQVFKLAEVQEDDTLIPKGTLLRTKEDSDLNTIYFETVEDLIIPSGSLGNEKDSDNEYIYTVKVVAGESIYQDVIGTSSGAPMQSFKCSYTNVLVDSLTVYVDEGNGSEMWTKVDSFFDTDENSKVYMVSIDDFDNCTIQFGNGIKGKIPNSYPNGITADYRIGGGEASNVEDGIINTLETGLALVDETFNVEILKRGRDKESLESIKMNAPAQYRTRNRLVTLQDYIDLLRINYYDFIGVQALRDDNDNYLVHVFYQLRDGYTFTPELSQSITDFINDRSMVGTSFDIDEYTAEDVDITAVLYVDSNYDSAEIESGIRDYLANTIFSADNVTFNTSLVKSDIESAIKNEFAGVMSFRINSPVEDIIEPSYGGNILTLGTVTITVNII